MLLISDFFIFRRIVIRSEVLELSSEIAITDLLDGLRRAIH